jgi:hypothetical protein
MTDTKYSYAIEDADEQFGVDAQTAGQELDRIRRRDGTIRPSVVVNESRPEEAPLHPVFEWRDAVAAEKYREHQATNLVKVVRVVTPPRDKVAAPTQVAVERRDRSEPVVSRHDPFEAQLSEVVGQMVETERRLEQIRLQAQRSFDRPRMIRLQVALTALQEAHEALVAANQSASWDVNPCAAMAK